MKQAERYAAGGTRSEAEFLAASAAKNPRPEWQTLGAKPHGAIDWSKYEAPAVERRRREQSRAEQARAIAYRDAYALPPTTAKAKQATLQRRERHPQSPKRVSVRSPKRVR